MAEMKLVLDKDEKQEKKKLLEFSRSLTREEKLKFKGFLEGISFVRNCRVERH